MNLTNQNIIRISRCVAIEDFNKKLEAIMAKRGLTIADVARRTGLHYVVIRGYLKKGKWGKTPSLESLYKLMDGFPCSFEELTGRTDVREPEKTVITDREQRLLDRYRQLADSDPDKLVIELILLRKAESNTEPEKGTNGIDNKT